jgi:hypothetical protein
VHPGLHRDAGNADYFCQGGAMKSLGVILILMYVSILPVLADISASEIITKAEVSTRGDTSYALYELTVKSRRGTRTLGIKVFDDRLRKRSMAEVTSPARDAGNRFLTMNDTMWHYVPNLQETVRISASMMLQPWMGSDFTNDDIVKSSSIIRDYTHTLLGREVVNGEQCYKLQLFPNHPQQWCGAKFCILPE